MNILLTMALTIAVLVAVVAIFEAWRDRKNIEKFWKDLEDNSVTRASEPSPVTEAPYVYQPKLLNQQDFDMWYRVIMGNRSVDSVCKNTGLSYYEVRQRVYKVTDSTGLMECELDRLKPVRERFQKEPYTSMTHDELYAHLEECAQMYRGLE